MIFPLSVSSIARYAFDGCDNLNKVYYGGDEYDWSEIDIGDLVFQNEYPEADSNHVGVCVGFFTGRPVFAHCSSTEDTVVVTTAGGLFRYARRPAALTETQEP